MEYFLKPLALKNLRKLSPETQRRIIEKLDFYIRTSTPLSFADKLTDIRFGEWRFRVGEYRVIFDIEEGNIVILKIGHRREVYR